MKCPSQSLGLYSSPPILGLGGLLANSWQDLNGPAKAFLNLHVFRKKILMQINNSHHNQNGGLSVMTTVPGRKTTVCPFTVSALLILNRREGDSQCTGLQGLFLKGRLLWSMGEIITKKGAFHTNDSFIDITSSQGCTYNTFSPPNWRRKKKRFKVQELSLKGYPQIFLYWKLLFCK